MAENTVRSENELNTMRYFLIEEIKRLQSDTNKELIPNYDARIIQLRKMVSMIEDHMNFYPMVRWLNCEDVPRTEILNSIRVI